MVIGNDLLLIAVNCDNVEHLQTILKNSNMISVVIKTTT